MSPRSNVFLALSLLLFAVSACGRATPAATPDTQATVNAAVAATTTAQAANQAAIEAAVQATVTAQASAQAVVAATATVQTTPPPTATPIPAEQYVTMTKEQLTALIDQSVAQAVATNQQYAATTTNAAADNTITAAEVEAITAEVAQAEAAVAQAEELLAVYTDLYGEAAAAMAELEQISQTLIEIEASINLMNQTLAEINNALTQGLVLTEQTLAQLQTAAQTAQSKAAQMQTQAQNWATIRQTVTAGSKPAFPVVPPNQVAADLPAALQMARDFAQTGRDSLADDSVSSTELANLAQQAANAQAGLNAHGGAQGQELSGLITTITDQIARGDIGQAQAGLDGFANRLGSLPGLEKPAIDKPALDKPSLTKPSLDKPTRPNK